MKLLPLAAAPVLLCGAAWATPVTCGSGAPCAAPRLFNDFRYDRLEPLGAAPRPAAADVMVSPIGTALNEAYVFSAAAEFGAGVPVTEQTAGRAEQSPLSRGSARGRAEPGFSQAVGFAENGPGLAFGRACAGSECGSAPVFSIASLADPDSAVPGGRVPPVWTDDGQPAPGADGIDPAQDGAPGDGAVAPEPIAFALIGSALLVFGVLARYKSRSV